MNAPTFPRAVEVLIGGFVIGVAVGLGWWQAPLFAAGVYLITPSREAVR